MTFSIEEIVEEYNKQKQELEKIDNEIINTMNDGKTTENEIQEKKIQRDEIIDIISSIQEFCQEKIKEEDNAINKLDKIAKQIENINKKYKFKPERIKKQLSDLEEEMKKASQEIAQNSLNETEIKRLEQLQKEISDFIKNNKEIKIKKDETKKELETNDKENEKENLVELSDEEKLKIENNIEKIKQKKQTSQAQNKNYQDNTNKTSEKRLEKILKGINEAMNDDTEINNLNDNNVITEEPTNNNEVSDEVLEEIIKEINPTLDDVITEENEEDNKNVSENVEAPKEEINKTETKEEPNEQYVYLTPEKRKELAEYMRDANASKISKKVKRRVPKKEYESKKESVLKKVFNFFFQEIEEDIKEDSLKGEKYDGGKSL